MKTELLPQGFTLEDHEPMGPTDDFTRAFGPAYGNKGEAGAVQAVWTPEGGIVLEVTTVDDELTIDEARAAQANLGRVLEALDDLGH